LWYDNLSARDLLGAAMDYGWRVSWVGETGANGGVTVSGDTGWKQDASTESANTLYTDVDTSECGFSAQGPRYFASIHGDKNQWRLQGGHNVYSPTATGFRIYVTMDAPVLPSVAEANNWTVSWVGVSPGASAQREVGTGSAPGSWQKQGTMLGDVLFESVGFAALPPCLPLLASTWPFAA